jgi:sulfur relay protein TusC/DsrF
MSTSKALLIICRHSSWQASSAAGLEFALTAAAFEVPVCLVLLADAVLQLLPNQDGAPLQMKTYAKQIPALELYGITQVYAEVEALARYGLHVADCEIPVQALAAHELAALVANSHHCLVF